MGAGPSRPSVEVATFLLDRIDVVCAEAARNISEADILLLCTGAGFSADSGLAVYADVAKVQAYAARGLTYPDICQPRWLDKQPELFWGFWGQCHNDYRDTPPHEGYAIIDRWADRWFRQSRVARAVRGRLAAVRRAAEPGGNTGEEGGAEENAGTEPADAPAGAEQHISGCDEIPDRGAAGTEETSDEPPLSPEPYRVSGHAGSFFVFTSNVDAHHFDWFRACEIRECHGNTELYQCAEQGSYCRAVWRAPLDFRFSVDNATMLAHAGAAGVPVAAGDAADATEVPAAVQAPAECAGPGAAKAEEHVPRIGHVLGGGRPTSLRHMPGEPPARARAGFQSNHPSCPSCSGRARPAILMFGDMAWQDVEAQEERWCDWVAAATAEVEEAKAQEQGRPLRVAILEIGAGGNVTTVRGTSERHLRGFLQAGADARLIRVNPDMPLGDEEDFEPGGRAESCILSVMCRGLESLKKIDAAMPAVPAPQPEDALLQVPAPQPGEPPVPVPTPQPEEPPAPAAGAPEEPPAPAAGLPEEAPAPEGATVANPV